ncbi:nuclear/nucleolar GTPase 2 [Cucumis melo var. makuwa]|uniref:Nuclear/nucleolar GTPase 2 n=1 Tax=Cucumis melo var. makuwa TaxID=1194695 RepID=A0A5A7SXL6_CUCMM|nr:nuclear/nucleolar GTPase 2 [Cucumis melo var. makuwa]TYK30460.1 nuclear/nucleolar GTPase 2 [Cucumis melo var. makuwa]
MQNSSRSCLFLERRRPLLLSLTSSSSNVTDSCYRFDLNAASPLPQRCCYPFAATVQRLKMYNMRPKRDRKGKVLKNDLQSNELPDT